MAYSSYCLNWPGLETVPLVIMDHQQNIAYSRSNPLPRQKMHLLSQYGNKYVELSHIYELFDTASQANIMLKLLDVTNRFELHRAHRGTKQHAMVKLDTLLVFVFLFPYCPAFQLARSGILNYLVKWAEYPCMVCGFIMRDCVCHDGVLKASVKKLDVYGMVNHYDTKDCQTETSIPPKASHMVSLLPNRMPPQTIPQGALPVPPGVPYPYMMMPSTSVQSQQGHDWSNLSSISASWLQHYAASTAGVGVMPGGPVMPSVDPSTVGSLPMPPYPRHLTEGNQAEERNTPPCDVDLTGQDDGGKSGTASQTDQSMSDTSKRPINIVHPIIKKAATRDVAVQTRANFMFRESKKAKSKKEQNDLAKAVAAATASTPVPSASSTENSAAAARTDSPSVSTAEGDKPKETDSGPLTPATPLTTSTCVAKKIQLWKLIDSDSEEEKETEKKTEKGKAGEKSVVDGNKDKPAIVVDTSDLEVKDKTDEQQAKGVLLDEGDLAVASTSNQPDIKDSGKEDTDKSKESVEAVTEKDAKSDEAESVEAASAQSETVINLDEDDEGKDKKPEEETEEKELAAKERPPVSDEVEKMDTTTIEGDKGRDTVDKESDAEVMPQSKPAEEKSEEKEIKTDGPSQSAGDSEQPMDLDKSRDIVEETLQDELKDKVEKPTSEAEKKQEEEKDMDTSDLVIGHVETLAKDNEKPQESSTKTDGSEAEVKSSENDTEKKDDETTDKTEGAATTSDGKPESEQAAEDGKSEQAGEDGKVEEKAAEAGGDAAAASDEKKAEETENNKEENETKAQESEDKVKHLARKWCHKFEYTPTQEHVYKCTFDRCGQCFDSRAAARLHDKMHGAFGMESNRLLMCFCCSFSVSFSRYYELLRHLSVKHNIRICEETDLGCLFCGRVCETAEQLSKHMDFHYMDRFKCVHCGITLFTNKQLDKHLAEGCENKKEKQLGCPYCSLVFHIRSMRNIHVTSHTDEGLVCCFCPESSEKSKTVWENWKDLRKHYQQKHSSKLKKAPATGPLGPVPALKPQKNKKKDAAFQCHVCEEDFKLQNDFWYHMGKAHDYLPYILCVCEFCGKTFKMAKMCEWHVRNTHGDSIRCKQCEFVARNNLVLKEHMAAVHLANEHVCTDCGKGFSLYSQLRRHMAHHALHTIYTCRTCGQEFRRQRELREHENKAHPEPERSQACPECDFTSPSRRALEFHINKVHPTFAADFADEESKNLRMPTAPPVEPPPPVIPPLKIKVPKPGPSSALLTEAEASTSESTGAPAVVGGETPADTSFTEPVGTEATAASEGPSADVPELFIAPAAVKAKPVVSTKTKRAYKKRGKMAKKSKGAITLERKQKRDAERLAKLAAKAETPDVNRRSCARAKTIDEHRELKNKQVQKKETQRKRTISNTVEAETNVKRQRVSKYGRSIPHKELDDIYMAPPRVMYGDTLSSPPPPSPADKPSRPSSSRASTSRSCLFGVPQPETWDEPMEYPYLDHSYFLLENATTYPVAEYPSKQHRASTESTDSDFVGGISSMYSGVSNVPQPIDFEEIVMTSKTKRPRHERKSGGRRSKKIRHSYGVPHKQGVELEKMGGASNVRMGREPSGGLSDGLLLDQSIDLNDDLIEVSEFEQQDLLQEIIDSMQPGEAPVLPNPSLFSSPSPDIISPPRRGGSVVYRQQQFTPQFGTTITPVSRPSSFPAPRSAYQSSDSSPVQRPASLVGMSPSRSSLSTGLSPMKATAPGPVGNVGDAPRQEVDEMELNPEELQQFLLQYKAQHGESGLEQLAALACMEAGLTEPSTSSPYPVNTPISSSPYTVSTPAASSPHPVKTPDAQNTPGLDTSTAASAQPAAQTVDQSAHSIVAITPLPMTSSSDEAPTHVAPDTNANVEQASLESGNVVSSIQQYNVEEASSGVVTSSVLTSQTNSASLQYMNVSSANTNIAMSSINRQISADMQQDDALLEELNHVAQADERRTAATTRGRARTRFVVRQRGHTPQPRYAPSQQVTRAATSFINTIQLQRGAVPSRLTQGMSAVQPRRGVRMRGGAQSRPQYQQVVQIISPPTQGQPSARFVSRPVLTRGSRFAPGHMSMPAARGPRTRGRSSSYTRGFVANPRLQGMVAVRTSLVSQATTSNPTFETSPRDTSPSNT